MMSQNDKLRQLRFHTKIISKIHNLAGLLSTPKLTLSRRLKPAILSPIISYPVQGQSKTVWPHTPLSARGVGVANGRCQGEEMRDRNGEILTGIRAPGWDSLARVRRLGPAGPPLWARWPCVTAPCRRAEQSAVSKNQRLLPRSQLLRPWNRVGG